MPHAATHLFTLSHMFCWHHWEFFCFEYYRKIKQHKIVFVSGMLMNHKQLLWRKQDLAESVNYCMNMTNHYYNKT